MFDKIQHDIQQDYYQKNFSNDGQRFIAWYLRNIHNLDIIQAKDCITDRANDKQIDAVYINDQEQIIYIIQGKYYSGEYTNATSVREVFGAWGLLQDLQKLQDTANSKLKVKINEVSAALDDGYNICFELVTTSILTEQAYADALAFSKLISDNEDINANFIVVDNELLKSKYEESLGKSNSYVNYEFVLEDGKYMYSDLNGTKVVLAAIPLKDCVSIPGIKDQRLFRKNVRQSLGNNKINKGIARSVKKEPEDFFFCHNGITAICSKLNLDNNKLVVNDLNVVNGCQSLTTIYDCGEAAKKSYGYILFKFYEISDNEKADRIAVNTNSQNAVKARDLRSNDKIVLNIKKNYELAFPQGYFITKRGEIVDDSKYDKKYIVQLTDLGKELIAWHSQRPILSYSENKIFDMYFNQLFKKDYMAEDVQGLNELYEAVMRLWVPNNPLGMNESLLAMKSYAPFHHLYAISVVFAEVSNMSGYVPKPSIVNKQLNDNNMIDSVVNITGRALNRAFLNANSKYASDNKVFSPQNWIKSKMSIVAIEDTIRSRLDAMEDEESEVGIKVKQCCTIDKSHFETRWTAD